jgi:hypothetical protein
MRRALRQAGIGAALLGLVLGILILGSMVIRASSGSALSYHFALGEGERYQGDLAIAARDVHLDAESIIEGDVSIVALGDVRLAGRIEGDLSILAPFSAVEVAPGANIGGDLAICARSLSSLEGIAIGGRQNTGCDRISTILQGGITGITAAAPTIHLPFLSLGAGDTGTRLAQVGLSAFGVAAVAAFIAFLFPDSLRRMTATALARPRTAGATGMLAFGLTIGLTLLFLLLTILTSGALCLGLPLVAVGWAVLASGLLAGWIAIAYALGGWLLRQRGSHAPPIVTASLGALVLTLFEGGIQLVPCLGWLSVVLVLVIGLIGLGALILTRFGTRPYPEIVQRHVTPQAG